VRLPRGAAEELSALAARGSLVFVMRRAALLDVLYLRWLLARLGLPPLRAAHGLPALPAALGRVGGSTQALLRAAADGDSGLVFLGDPSRGRDAFGPLARLQRSLARPVILVPALLLWSLRAQRLRGSLGDLLLGSPDAPSAFAKGLGFLRNFRRTWLALGRAVALSEFSEARPEMSDGELGRTLRGALHQQLARELRTAVGPPLKSAARVREKVLRDRTLRASLAAVASDSGRSPEAVHREAERCLAEVASRFTPGFVRAMRPVLGWVFRRLYESVEADEDGLARVKRMAADAPVVLCPSHKSYVDFLVISWLLYERGMTPPHIAAGINLAFWPFGAIARRGGAFFIRRTVKGDRVYTAVLRAYVKHLMRDRFPQEFYVEGGRSRTGKLLFPKTGLLSMEVDAWLDGAAHDVLFVPVAIDYERLIEAGAYARELAGGEKQGESFRGLLGAVGVLFRRYERLYVQVEPAISLRQVAEARLGPGATSLALDTEWRGEIAEPALAAGQHDAPAEAKRRLVQAVANRIAWGIGRAVTITPVGLVAAVLLSRTRRALPASEVARRIELLRYVAAEGGARFGRGLAGAPSDPRKPGPVRDAVRRLVRGGLLEEVEAEGEAGYLAVEGKRPVLDYHRNAVIHRYVALGIVAAAVRTAGADGEASAREGALWISRLLKLEFMYRPGATFDETFSDNLAFLVRVGTVVREEQALRPGPEAWALELFGELTRPYLEAYRLAAETAAALVEGAGPDRRTLVKQALERGRAELAAGRLVREALSRATLENAVAWLVTSGRLAEDGGRLRLAQGPAAIREIIDGTTRHLPA
jgi:glycerol-3-phosphate O-acyltransferase